MNSFDNLNLITDKLNSIKTKKYKFPFSIPALWLGDPPQKIDTNPYEYFISQIKKIKSFAENPVLSKDLTVYNMFIRLSTAYDHNGDKSLDYKTGQFRETGTFLKAVSILPYIKSLGVNTIYLLPVTAIGEDEKKGNLGSPYAIRNPYMPDENLSEPLLGLDVETEFKAFTEAVHLCGMKLVCEFVFRTASIDSDLSLEHPEWFYWINNRIKNRQAGDTSEAKYGPPVFLKKELDAIKLKVGLKDFAKLTPPHEQFTKMFTEPPKKVARVDGKIRGVLPDKKTEVRIPGAFADWPPDDSQPAWSDVTYLRLFSKPKFNYIAYNTVRMYDSELEKKEFAVADLWDYITGIIPHYINEFGIDGVMIDMGHALPTALRKELVKKAIETKPDFFFWEENFGLSEKSVEEGYSAVLGYLPFDMHKPDKVSDMIQRFSRKDIPVNFFATSETHNTPRAFGRIPVVNYLKSVYAFCAFLPAITFIHSGFELSEINPVNTGLDFTPDEIEKYPPERLGLFSGMQLDWDNENEITEFISKINSLKNEYIGESDDIQKTAIFPIESDSKHIVAFVRRDSAKKTEIVLAANYNSEKTGNCTINFYEGALKVTDLIAGTEIPTLNGSATFDFEPYQLKIFKIGFE